MAETKAIEPSKPSDKGDDTYELFLRLNKSEGTPEDVERFRQLLIKKPDLWDMAGDMAKRAAEALIDSMSSNQLTVESLRAGRLAQRKELGFDTATPVERLLIDHVVLCRLRLHNTELLHTARMKGNLTLAQAEHYDKMLTVAQWRFLRAVEALARVGKILRSVTVQVNIGEKQVNVAGGGPAVSAGATAS